MIYFISAQKRLFESKEIQIGTIEQCINYCKKLDFVGIDTETTGFNPHNDKVLLLQLGDFNNQFVIDSSIDFKLFKELLETKTLIGQNLKFDLRFLYNLDIWPNKVYDTYLAEVKLTQGIIDIKRNLQVLNEKYVGTSDVDKSLRGLIHKGITDIVIKYASNDVKPLHIIREKQLEKAQELQMIKAIDLENEFVLILAYCEYCGMYVDPNKWINKIKLKEKELIIALETLNNYVLSNNLNNYIEMQLDLFSSERTINLNWNSDIQVKKLFKELGINIFSFEGGIKKESVDAKILKPQEKSFTIIPLYLEYKRLEKDISTYGYKFLSQINKKTGRLYTSFTQIVDTGRMSSGGKNKNTKEEYINFQNIPADKETRSCFTNQFPNTILINCDYSGMESVVLANISQEPNLIQFYNDNLGDLHSYVASKLFKELNGLSLIDIKKYHKDKRQIAKSANFALAYGGTGYTIARNLSISKEAGEEVEQAYFEAFKDLKDYFDLQEKNALEKGYILIDSLTGSKFFLHNFEEFLELHKKYTFSDNRIFWDKYKVEKAKNSFWFQSEKENISHYFRWKSQIRRNAQNFPIQGSSASITKIAGILLFRWIKQNNLLNRVLISNIVHDEYILESNINIAEEVSKQVKQCMEQAGTYYCKQVPLKAEPVIALEWGH